MQQIFNYNRSLIAIKGEDGKIFLQGLLTNDVNSLREENLLYSLMLNSQGRFLYDFFIFEKNEIIYLECLDFRRDEIIKKLNFYKLRSKVEISKNDDFEIGFLSVELDSAKINQKLAKKISDNIFIFCDPRNEKMLKRIYFKKDLKPEVEEFFKSELSNCELCDGELQNQNSKFNDIFFIEQDNPYYDFSRISLKIAESEKDLTLEKSLILEYGFDQLNAISYQKGCYVGQELTARTHYLGEIRKKIFHIKIPNLTEIAKNSEIFCDEKVAGEILSSVFYQNQLHALAIIKNHQDLDLTKLTSLKEKILIIS
jgi:hypothetical protein